MTTRNGKIARLPAEIREQLNQRLHDGEQGNSLVNWLNSCPQVIAILAADFDGRPISKQNLHEWRRGGFRDWLAHQQALEAVRLLGADADEINRAASGQITRHLAVCMAARIAVELKNMAAAKEKAPGTFNKFIALCDRLAALQRGSQNAEWIQIERDRLAHQISIAQHSVVEKLLEYARRPEIQELVCARKDSSEVMKELVRLMFGEPPQLAPIVLHGENVPMSVANPPLSQAQSSLVKPENEETLSSKR